MSDEPTKKKKKTTWGDIIRFYLTAIAILAATISSFAFVFLVPFVIDPGFSTIFAKFDEEPRVCVTVSSVSRFGLSNCTWSSCREGCTREVFRCTQIYVNYFKDTTGSFHDTNYTDPQTFNTIPWEYIGAKIYPNVKGCGYPPELNCTVFNAYYSTNGTTFPCYYSKIQPEMALTHLDIDEIKTSLAYAIVIPWGCFLTSVLYLLIAYLGMARPEPPAEDDALDIYSSKASKDASNYSLRSISKTISQGVNRFRGDHEDRGCKVAPAESYECHDHLLSTLSLTHFKKRDTLPPLERTPKMPRPGSTTCHFPNYHEFYNDDDKKSWP